MSINRKARTQAHELIEDAMAETMGSPHVVDIVWSPAVGYSIMHVVCSEHLPDEGWEYMGRSVLGKDRLRTLEPQERKCAWCGHSIFRKVYW